MSLFISHFEDAHLVLADQEVAVDPGVVLLEELRAILALPEEDLAATRVHLRVFSNVIDFALVDGPAVVLRLVLLDIVSRIIYSICILD